jgi:hypothetical protein
MKDIVHELANKARQSVTPGLAVNRWIDEYNEKFAELIVKECYVALFPALRDMISRGQAYDMIKKHFDIE